MVEAAKESAHWCRGSCSGPPDPRDQWPLGMVVKTVMGDDSLVQWVFVRTAQSSCLDRHMTDVVLLEGVEEEEATTASEAVSGTVVASGTISSPGEARKGLKCGKNVLAIDGDWESCVPLAGEDDADGLLER